MRILKDGECPDVLWGLEKETITNEMIEALHDGKTLYLTVNDEYAVVIKKETTSCMGCYFNVAHKEDTICEICSRHYFDKYYAAGGNENVPH